MAYAFDNDKSKVETYSKNDVGFKFVTCSKSVTVNANSSKLVQFGGATKYSGYSAIGFSSIEFNGGYSNVALQAFSASLYSDDTNASSVTIRNMGNSAVTVEIIALMVLLKKAMLE